MNAGQNHNIKRGDRSFENVAQFKYLGTTVTNHRLRVSENRVLRRIFGPKSDEVIEGWRNLHNEELYNLYCSSNIIRTIKSRSMRLAGHLARMGAKRNAYRIFVGKTKGKRPLGIPRIGGRIISNGS
jgi:hypothetical protein